MDDEFDYQYLDNDVNLSDLLKSIANGELLGITSETDGGIIAYAIGLPHALQIVNALRTVETI